MQQAYQPKVARLVAQRAHDDLLVVRGPVGVFEYRRDFVLPRSYLVVPRLGRHAQQVQLLLNRMHAADHAVFDIAEVVVVQLLPLGRLGADQGPSAVDQVRGAGNRILHL